MFLDRWRARRALMTRTAPTPISDEADVRLRRVVEPLATALDSDNSLGDPIWHCRWEGELQVVGLDATSRSLSDVRQRALRLVHELALRHMASRARRVLLVVLCAPEQDEGLEQWQARLWGARGEVSEPDWSSARRRLAVLAVDRNGRHELSGGDTAIRNAVAAWAAADGQSAGA